MEEYAGHWTLYGKTTKRTGFEYSIGYYYDDEKGKWVFFRRGERDSRLEIGFATEEECIKEYEKSAEGLRSLYGNKEK